jgi:hypothetical protein
METIRSCRVEVRFDPSCLAELRIVGPLPIHYGSQVARLARATASAALTAKSAAMTKENQPLPMQPPTINSNAATEKSTHTIHQMRAFDAVGLICQV